MTMVHCRGCGQQIHETAPTCPHCGAPQTAVTGAGGPYSQKQKVVAALLCFFVGCFGIHRFYVGKIGTGILQLLTLGGLGIWAFIDFILILLDKFTDKQGLVLAK